MQQMDNVKIAQVIVLHALDLIHAFRAATAKLLNLITKRQKDGIMVGNTLPQ